MIFARNMAIAVRRLTIHMITRSPSAISLAVDHISLLARKCLGLFYSVLSYLVMQLEPVVTVVEETLIARVQN